MLISCSLLCAEVLQAQIQEAPDDFCIDELSSQNFLTHCVQVCFSVRFGLFLSVCFACVLMRGSLCSCLFDSQALLENSEGLSLSPGLAKQLSELRALMHSKFRWDFDSALLDADSEFAPVVADLDPDGEVAQALKERGINVRTE